MSTSVPSTSRPSASQPGTSQPSTAVGAWTVGPRARRTGLAAGAAVLVVTATLSALFANTSAERFIDVGVGVVATAVVYLLVVPHGLERRTVGAGAVVLGGLSVLLVMPVFWTGLPLVFGVAAALLGNAGRREPQRSGLALVALVCGLLGSIGYVAAYVSDILSHT